MRKHSPTNERIKRQYFVYLKEAKRHSEPTIDAVAMALNRFEEYTRYRDFKSFHIKQAVGFKKQLAEQKGKKSGGKLSKSTLNSTLAHLKRFFQWLAGQPGYKSRIQYADADYFNLSEKDTRIAMARREKRVPTLDQVRHVILSMLAETEIDRRNRALIAFTLLTGARDSAIASMKIKHIDLSAGSVYQDAREVKTKFSKSFTTVFFPVGDDIRRIFTDWITYLEQEMLWDKDAPLFPATRIALGNDQRFQASGLDRKHWSSAAPIRTIFRDAFERSGLPYFNPHSFRNTLVRLGETVCKTPEDFKAWSQNLGHEEVLTTFYSYGTVPSQRQREIIENLGSQASESNNPANDIAEAVVRKLREGQL